MTYALPTLGDERQFPSMVFVTISTSGTPIVSTSGSGKAPDAPGVPLRGSFPVSSSAVNALDLDANRPVLARPVK